MSRITLNIRRLIISDIPNIIGSMSDYDIIIIGAGAAGLLAGGKCSEAGLKTAVFDGMSRAGRKLLITGQGRCNVTNNTEMSDFISHYGERSRFAKKCLYGFSNKDLMKLLSLNGCETIARDDGKVFPASERSSDVLNCLLRLCSKSYMKFHFDSRITAVSHEAGGFTVTTDAQNSFSASKLLIAAGGFTFPTTGSKGDGFRLAESLGHNIIRPRPSLTAVISREEDFAICAGISLEAETRLFRDGLKKSSRRGPLLFTHTGLSGPLIIDNSREIDSDDRLEVNLLPDLSDNELNSSFISYCTKQGRSRIKNFFTGLALPERLVTAVFARLDISPEKKSAEITKLERRALFLAFTGLTFNVKQLDGKKKAMCTAGGVDTTELKPATMESKLIAGLYFAGEVIDVDGDSGGYNLQFAFSSASAAAESIIKI